MMPQTDHTPPMQGDEAFRRRERARRRTQWTLQIVVLAVIVGCLWLLAHNVGANLVERNIRSGFGFLSGSAGFDIGEALLPFESTDSVLKAFVNGVLNTIRVSFFAAISALILGVVVGLMRLASHPILRALGTAHVEFYRNIPLIIQLFAIYMLITELLPMSTEPLHFGSWAMLSKAGFYIAVPEQTKLALLAAVIAAVLVALLLREIWRRRVTDLVAALIGLAGGAVALIVVWCLMSWFPIRPGSFFDDLRGALGMLVEPYLGLFRRFIPPIMGVDWSPVVAILVLSVIERLIYTILL